MTYEMKDAEPIPAGFTDLKFWDEGLETAKSWYHEEWEGTYIQWCLARDIANTIARVVAPYEILS